MRGARSGGLFKSGIATVLQLFAKMISSSAEEDDGGQGTLQATEGTVRTQQLSRAAYEVWVEPGAISLLYKGSCRGTRATINLPETIFNLLRCNVISANDHMTIPVFFFF